MQNAADVCFEAIRSQAKRPLFVAVTGDSGSGKSYLVSLLVGKFKAADLPHELINHDEFLIPREERELMKTKYYSEGRFAGKSHWEVLENMFRLGEYERVIRELRAGRPTSFRPYSRETGTIAEAERTVRPKDFIIFDTSMMLDKMDFVILVDVTQENIIQRKLTRDSDIRTPEQIVNMHTRVQGYYWEDRGKPSNPDIIIDNNDFTNVKIIQEK